VSALTLPPPPLGPRGRLWVGYSGGCDSTVLLELLHSAGVPVHAVHVHHGLQQIAEDWVRHCRRYCRARAIPLRVLRVQPDPDHPQGPEAAARAARYAAFAPLLRTGDVLALAHHRDDQAETVLMRALRGSGIAGLGAMRATEALGKGLLWRPLLAVARERLQAIARARELAWIDDPHNDDPRYTRAFLRAQVMPVLNAHFPSAPLQLAKLAAHARDTQAVLAQIADEDAARCGGTDDGGLDVATLLALTPERWRNLVYHRWCALGLLPPPQSWYVELERAVLRARPDARPLLVCGDGEARRRKRRLYLSRRRPN
jgi:tRNA(Ile)-lysidine synthase